MSLLRNLIIGAAVVAGVNYITKKRPDGKSMMDDLKERAPDLMNKAREFGNTQKEKFTQRADRFASSSNTTDTY
ncbi:YtxH domain-containing protein [Flavihumibacter sp. R14]|nr:YtxH domain-containing protein [Flavihumibacter soli]